MSASADIRKGFLRKVYGILSVQLLMTTGVSGKISILNRFSFLLFTDSHQISSFLEKEDSFLWNIQNLFVVRKLIFLLTVYKLGIRLENKFTVTFQLNLGLDKGFFLTS